MLDEVLALIDQGMEGDLEYNVAKHGTKCLSIYQTQLKLEKAADPSYKGGLLAIKPPFSPKMASFCTNALILSLYGYDN